MRNLTKVCGCLVALALPAAVAAQNAEQVFDKMFEQEAAGLRDIDSMLLGTETMGMTQLEYYEKTSRVDVNGETMYILRNVPPQEIEQRHSAGNPMADATPGELRSAADEIELQTRRMGSAMEQEMQDAGMPGFLGDMLMNPPDDQPWLSANPRDMGTMYGTMLRGAAQGKEEQAARDAAAFDGMGDRAWIAGMTKWVGETIIDGRPAHHLVASDLNHRQVSDGVEFTLHTMNMWVDANDFVPLRLKMDGVVREGGESRPISIERHDQDYRRVPGCGSLNQPFRSVMKISGMMNAEQEAQMREAQVQMAEMEKQLQQMPAAQRDMVMRQMGPQMQMMKTMSAGGGMEVVSNVVELKCNVPMPSPQAMAQAMLGGGMAGQQAGMLMPGSGMPAAPVQTSLPENADAARQACLQEKVAVAQEAQKKKRGFGKLLGAAGRVASRFGNQDVAQVASDIHGAGATADDVVAAARDLGLTEDEIAACDNPD
jgi:hypothetical protein